MTKPFRTGSQRHRVVSAFIEGRRLHRFQAEALGCHALHSAVSDLEKTGLKFDRRTVSVSTRWGADAHVSEYWLAPESYPLAAQLLGHDEYSVPYSEAVEEAYSFLPWD